jgi:hypothetical protein
MKTCGRKEYLRTGEKAKSSQCMIKIIQNQCKNYRGVTLFSYCLKIYERIIILELRMPVEGRKMWVNSEVF